MKKNHYKKPKSLRKHINHSSKTALAFGLSTLVAGTVAIAQEEETFNLDKLSIEDRTNDTNPYAEPGAPYKAKTSGDSRHVKDIADTPQTISVLTQTMIQEAGVTDLRDILDSQPGITLGTGENGNAFGDRYVIRGHEARSDVFVDGLRDPGMTTRESFAVEQVEITKGPSSTFAGRGSTGGAVNSITKQASAEYNFNKIQAGLGTDEYRRFTLDSNIKVNDDIAFRANLLHAFEGIPDRDENEREREGAALSFSWEANDKFKLIADYYCLDALDKADLGSYIDRETGTPNDNVPSYVQDQDFVESTVHTGTLRLEYQLSESVRFENSTRYGTTDNGYVVTGASGTTRDESDPAGAIPTITLSTHQGWQEVDYFANQFNVFIDHELGGTEHKWVIGSEYSQHDVLNGTYSVNNTGDSNCLVAGRGGVSNGYCILDENGATVTNVHNLLDREITKGDFDSDYEIDTLSLYVMDTVDLNDSFSVFAGIRADIFDYSNVIVNRDGVAETYEYDDTLWNGHLGVVYNLHEDGNIYASFSTAANINGGESDVGGSCGYGGLCTGADDIDRAEPEDIQNIELGTKWNLLDDKLLATAAIFQITKDNVMEGADYETSGTYNTGKNRVEGFEISLVGNITEKLSTQFGFTWMESEILETAAQNRDGTPVPAGGILANFADESGFLQLRYQATDKFSFGGKATYSSEVFTGQPDSTANESLGVPSYTVYDLFASYDFTDTLQARVNVGNITDEDYYLTAYRSGAFAYIGDARNAQMTVTYEF